MSRPTWAYVPRVKILQIKRIKGKARSENSGNHASSVSNFPEFNTCAFGRPGVGWGVVGWVENVVIEKSPTSQAYRKFEQ